MGNLPTIGFFPGHLPGGNSVTVGLRFPPGPPPDGQTVGLGKNIFGIRRTMLNVSGGAGPVGFALKMLLLEDSCRIWVKLLMNEALQVIWPPGKSHAERQRLICSGGLRIDA